MLEQPGEHPTQLGGAVFEYPASESVRPSSFVRVYSVQDGGYQLFIDGEGFRRSVCCCY